MDFYQFEYSSDLGWIVIIDIYKLHPSLITAHVDNYHHENILLNEIKIFRRIFMCFHFRKISINIGLIHQKLYTNSTPSRQTRQWHQLLKLL